MSFKTVWGRLISGAVLLVSASAFSYASDVDIESEISVTGLNNSSIGTTLTSTDAFDSWHSCTLGNKTSCTASNDYGSPPKNVHVYICIPSTMDYSFTSDCASLMTQNDDGDCHKNSTQVPLCGSGMQYVGPDCQWRTTSSGTAKWNWSIKAESGLPYSIQCSNSGFSGTH